MEASTPFPKTTKKRKLLLNENDKIEGEDRISLLPDSILHHILSCIPTHHVVRTCVLSKRWRHIWTGVPKLSFNEWCVLGEKMYNKINFIEFVENVLRRRDATSIYRFDFLLKNTCDGNRSVGESRLKKLITKVLRRKVQELDLHITFDNFIVFPRSLCLCESLTVLKIHGCGSTLKLPALVCFPNLKLIHFKAIGISHRKGVKQVSLNCPVLEKLILLNCEWIGIKTVDILAPSLVKLMISDAVYEHQTDCEIKFHAENLVTIFLVSNMTCGLSFCNTSSLNDVHIVIVDDLDNNHRVRKLMQGIISTKVLIVTHLTILKLSSVKELLAFSNLRSLVVTISQFLNGELLTELFCSVPHLDSLRFTNGLNKNSLDTYDWAVEAIPQSFLLHLKSFSINRFYGNNTELSLVEFLLTNARALEKIVIGCSSELSADPKKQLEITKRLLILPKASASCVIDFHELRD